VLEQVLASGRDVVLVCSGTNGKFSLEDAVCGGFFVSELRRKLRQDCAENDAAGVALSIYHQLGKNLLAALKSSAHGKYLVRLGFEQDLQTAAEVDSLSVVPEHEAGRFVWLAEKTEPGAVPREFPVGAR
jgi:2-phosphosulfolactate phosphatase